MTTDQGPADLPTRKLPGVFMFVISLAIGFHLLALGTMVLSAQSGPWAVRYLPAQPSQGEPPQFAANIGLVTTPYYLHPLGLANNYHFESNTTDRPSILLEIGGDAKRKTDTFPDASANMWVRFRQRLLINRTGEDFPFQPQQMKFDASSQVQHISFFFLPYEAVTAKLTFTSALKDLDFDTRAAFVNQLARTLTKEELDRYQEPILDLVEKERAQMIQQLGPQAKVPYRLTDRLIPMLQNQDSRDKSAYLYEALESKLPKVQQVFRPSTNSLILVRSLARYFERQRSEPVELVRLFRNPLGPAMMLRNMADPSKLLIDEPPYPLETFYHSFGNGQPKPWSPK